MPNVDQNDLPWICRQADVSIAACDLAAAPGFSTVKLAVQLIPPSPYRDIITPPEWLDPVNHLPIETISAVLLAQELPTLMFKAKRRRRNKNFSSEFFNPSCSSSHWDGTRLHLFLQGGQISVSSLWHVLQEASWNSRSEPTPTLATPQLPLRLLRPVFFF